MTMPLRSRKFKIWYLVLHICNYYRSVCYICYWKMLHYERQYNLKQNSFVTYRTTPDFYFRFNLILSMNVFGYVTSLRVFYKSNRYSHCILLQQKFSMSQRTLNLLHTFMPFLWNILLYLCAFSCLGISNKEQWPFHGPKNTNL